MAAGRLVVWLAVAALLGAALRPAPAGPRLVPEPGVPPELAELADATWEAFLRAFPARRDCLGTVRLRAARRLEDRAAYLPDEGVVVLRTPASAARLEESLVHELAHHLEFACPEQEELREAFLAAQGRDPGAAWFGGSSWASVPSEQFAEAVSEVVLGRRLLRPDLVVTPRARRLVAAWGRGEPVGWGNQSPSPDSEISS